MLRAVTFDFWDTLVHDDSDEPKRAARGLLPKAQARRNFFVDAVRSKHSDISERRVEEAWAHSLEWCHQRWKQQCVTPTLEERVDAGLQALGLPTLDGRVELIEQLAWMEVVVQPDLVEGARACLEGLSGFRIGIVSDATTSPGRALREILRGHELLGFFDHTAFSDEVGAAKPSAAIFRAAAEGLGVRPDELVHIGDREPHDIAGAHAFGAASVLFTGAVDRTPAQSVATARLQRLEDLPALIAQLRDTGSRARPSG